VLRKSREEGRAVGFLCSPYSTALSPLRVKLSKKLERFSIVKFRFRFQVFQSRAGSQAIIVPQGRPTPHIGTYPISFGRKRGIQGPRQT
jgi:hypothetical protein